MKCFCRYTTLNKDLPYVYVGRRLYDQLNRSLLDHANYTASFLQSKKIDHKVIYDDKNFKLLPSRKCSDFKTNKDLKRNLHFLLNAEPQCGKTGAYLYLLKLLRDEIEGINDTLPDFEHELDQDDNVLNTVGPLLRTVDQFSATIPHWQMLKNLPPVPTHVNGSKYQAYVPNYKYPMTTVPQLPEIALPKSSLIQKNQPALLKYEYSTHQLWHNSSMCTLCTYEVSKEELFLNVSSCMQECERIRLSFPSFDHYKRLIQKKEYDENMVHIMTPSHQRWEKARLNWNHMMINDNGRVEPFVLMVRNSSTLCCDR